jgi:hypothetical protein
MRMRFAHDGLLRSRVERGGCARGTRANHEDIDVDLAIARSRRARAGGARDRRWPAAPSLPRAGCLPEQRRQHMGEAAREAELVELPLRREDVGLLELPDRARRLFAVGIEQDGVDRASSRLVRRLHRGDVGVGSHVVGGEQQVGDARRHLGPMPPRAHRVDEERLLVHERPIRTLLDAVGQIEVEEVVVGERALPAGRHVDLDLLPYLVTDLFGRALARRLLHVGARLVPIGDAKREQPLGVTAPERAHRSWRPVLGLRNARQCPRRVDEDHVPGRERNVTTQEELRPGHPRAGEKFDLR